MKKADATMQHWFSNAYIKFLEKEEKSWKRLTQQRNTDFHTSRFYHQKSWVSFLYKSLFSCNNATLIWKRTCKILREKKLKRGEATTQHWFLNAYIQFFKEEEKSWKPWRNNATLIFIHLDSTTKKAEFPSCTEVFSHATLPHWYWNAPIKFWRKKLK